MTEATVSPRVWHDILAELAVKMGDHPLPLALALAVPSRILDLVAAGGPTPEDWAFCKDVGDVIAEKGDVLIFGSKNKGEAADLFNNLARAIAIAAFVPGGIEFGENRFEAMVKKSRKARKKKGKVSA